MNEAKPILVVYLARHSNREDITRVQHGLEIKMPDYHVFVLSGTTHQQALVKFKVYNNKNVTDADAVSLKQLILDSIYNANLNQPSNAQRETQ